MKSKRWFSPDDMWRDIHRHAMSFPREKLLTADDPRNLIVGFVSIADAGNIQSPETKRWEIPLEFIRRHPRYGGVTQRAKLRDWLNRKGRFN